MKELITFIYGRNSPVSILLLLPTFTQRLPSWNVDEEIEEVKGNFGWVFADEFENEFYIAYSPGQSGDARWCIVHTSVDMGQTLRSGVCKTADLEEQLNKVMNDLTEGWGL